MIPKSERNRIFALQKKAVRAVIGTHSKAHTNIIFHSLQILPFESLIRFNSLIFMFKYSEMKVPSTFLNTWPTVYQQNPNRLTRSANELYIQRVLINILNNHPFFILPRIWNDFKETFKTTTKLTIFKRQLKRYLLDSLDLLPCQDPQCYACNKSSQH